VSSRRFPGVELTDWRSRVVDRFPRLFPDARPYRDADDWALSCSGYPDTPDGWRRIVERACERLDGAIAAEPDAEAVILNIKEKYGSLQLHVSTVGLSAQAQEAVALAVDLAEVRSFRVCAQCGEPGRLWSREGWLSTCCDQHGEGRPAAQEQDQDQDVEITTAFVDGKPVRTARRYLPDEDCFVPATIPNEDQHHA
jgi:hypothetical protein